MRVLSHRQEQVLELLANGLSSKEIGRALGVSHETVRKHLANMRKLLGVRRATEMTAYWHAMGVENIPTPDAYFGLRGSLTHRENEVARLLARGLSIKQVSLILNVAPGTAAKHRENLFGKLGVRKTSLLPLLMKDVMMRM